MSLPNRQDDMVNNVPLFAEVRLSYYDSDDAAMFEAYNYSEKKNASLEEDDEEEELVDKENTKENSVAAPNPQATDGIYPGVPLGNYGYGFTYPPGSVPPDTSHLPAYNPAFNHDLARMQMYGSIPSFPPVGPPNNQPTLPKTQTQTKPKSKSKAKPKAKRPTKKAAPKKRTVAEALAEGEDFEPEDEDRGVEVANLSTKFSPTETTTLLDIIEEIKPIGKYKWDHVAER